MLKEDVEANLEINRIYWAGCLERQGKKNIYHCNTCSHEIITIDTDAGTTPMIMACTRKTPHCNGQMRSSWYPEAIQERTPTHEWYRPSSIHKSASRSAFEHVIVGGLLLREIEDEGQSAVGSVSHNGSEASQPQ